MISQYKTSEQYLSNKEFSDPFYVIVHSDEAFRDKIGRRNRIFKKTLIEIHGIKKDFEFTEISSIENPEILPRNLPEDRTRPILVAGFFGDICVKMQRDTLQKNGYNAHISLEGTYLP